MITRSTDSALPIVIPGLLYRDGSAESPCVSESGLTKREYFAALALQGLLASSPQSAQHGYPIYADHSAEIAAIAANMADRLIEALNAEQ